MCYSVVRVILSFHFGKLHYTTPYILPYDVVARRVQYHITRNSRIDKISPSEIYHGLNIE